MEARLGGVEEESSTVESWQSPLSEGRATSHGATLFVLCSPLHVREGLVDLTEG
jgi:hypothetical protein